MSQASTFLSKAEPFGVLDVGTSKICCLIAIPNRDGEVAMLGFGHHRSAGIKSGMIVDADEAERAIRATIDQAERMAGLRLESVTVAVSCGRLGSQAFVARAGVEGPLVTDRDLDRALAGAEAYAQNGGRMLLHLDRSAWRLDTAAGIVDPRGMAGRALGVDITAVTADDGPVRNLLTVIERCHLEVAQLVPAPVASAMAVTQEAERDARVLVVDIGGGATTLAAFAEARLVCVDGIPVGSNHVTFDIARALVTTVAEAERIKTLYGTLVKAASDAAELISYPMQGEEEPVLYQTSKAQLRSVIEPRIEGLFGLIEERLRAGAYGAPASGRVVLTGGASQLLGLDQAWMHRFGGEARIGRPRPLSRMPGSMCSSAFATVVGLTSLGGTMASWATQRQRRGTGTGHYLGRMQQWIGDRF